jgi:hypothetical protein
MYITNFFIQHYHVYKQIPLRDEALEGLPSLTSLIRLVMVDCPVTGKSLGHIAQLPQVREENNEREGTTENKARESLVNHVALPSSSAPSLPHGPCIFFHTLHSNN